MEMPSRKTPGQVCPHRVVSHLAVNLAILFAMALISFTSFSIAFAETTPTAEPSLEIAMVRPNDMNTGALLLPSKEPGQYIEAPRLSTDVDMRINGPIARVKVTQRFENPADGWVEGIYVFPLPEMSAVDTLKMRVGDRLIEGVIKVREEARRIYEEAKREGRKAALLEQQRENLFTNNVANIGPGETVVVQIEYQQTVEQDHGLFSLRFPMVMAPRYSPRPVIQTVDFQRNGNGGGFGVVDPVPDREQIAAPILDPRENAKINPVTMTVRLAAGFPIGSVKSPYHSMIERGEGDDTRILTLQNESVPADRDFVLEWRAKGDAPNAALFRETVEGRDYVLAFLTPPELPVADLPKKDREVVFVIDNSGSMAGESMVQAKAALENALTRLGPADRFNIVRFDDTLEVLFPDAVPADSEYVGQALRFVRGLEANGGTEMLPALRAALVDRNAGDEDRLRQVVFITDGAIGNEQQLFDAIAKGRGRSRIFTVGIGSAPNSFFMSRAAEMGRGTFTHIGAVTEVREKMQDFFAKLENPVMTGLSVQGVGANLSEASPDPLPDLYKGEPVVLAAIVSDDGQSGEGLMEISGDYAGQPWKIRMNLAEATQGEGIGKLWARRKIASLEAERSYGGDMAAIDGQIEKVALAHHLVSSRTSLVAVDVPVSRPSGETLDSRKLPLNLPAGWDADKWFDEQGDQSAPAPQKAMLNQMRAQSRMMLAAAPSAEGAAELAKQNRQAVTLPQTATDAERRILIGLLMILLAAAMLFVNHMARLLASDAARMERRRRNAERDRLPW